jgi:hypothetical protein
MNLALRAVVASFQPQGNELVIGNWVTLVIGDWVALVIQ